MTNRPDRRDRGSLLGVPMKVRFSPGMPSDRVCRRGRHADFVSNLCHRPSPCRRGQSSRTGKPSDCRGHFCVPPPHLVPLAAQRGRLLSVLEVTPPREAEYCGEWGDFAGLL